jgi:hypothetical protein
MHILLMIACVAYVKYNLSQGVDEKKLLSHYDFLKAIALA